MVSGGEIDTWRLQNFANSNRQETKSNVHTHKNTRLGFQIYPLVSVELNCFQFYFICLLNYYAYVPVVVSVTIKMTKLPTIPLRGIISTKHTLTVPIQYHPLTKVVKSTGVVSQIRKEVFDSFRSSTTMIDSGKKTKVTTRPSIHTLLAVVVLRGLLTATHTEDESDKEVLKVVRRNSFLYG